MTLDEMEAFFEKYEDEHYQFDRVPIKISARRDLHVFILMDRLVRSNHVIVSSAEHDEIWLDVDPEEFAAVANEGHIQELVRCGVRYDEDNFCMFV